MQDDNFSNTYTKKTPKYQLFNLHCYYITMTTRTKYWLLNDYTNILYKI
jgi:hypothetical protein